MPKPITPTCPNCGYDLTGLIEQGSSATCPECGTDSTYAQATYRKPPTPTTKRALIFLFAIPSLISLGSWGLLYLGDYLQGVDIVMPLMAILNLFLPIYTITLIVQDWRSRQLTQTYCFRFPASATILIILLCTGVSEIFLWLSLGDWIEAIANV